MTGNRPSATQTGRIRFAEVEEKPGIYMDSVTGRLQVEKVGAPIQRAVGRFTCHQLLQSGSYGLWRDGAKAPYVHFSRTCAYETRGFSYGGGG